MNESIAMNPNLLVRHLNKPKDQFTKADIIRFVKDNNIEKINFRYCGWDGRLKTLNFIINSLEHLNDILSSGERVDGSSLFPFVETGSSDLYVIPKYKTAFVNPFADVPTLDILCSFFNRQGKPFDNSPEYILKKAHKTMIESTGYSFETMGELEYYIIADEEKLYPAINQKGYHESSPFNKFGEYRTEAMRLIAQAGGQIKYGHAEVGSFTHNGKIYEQNEIEFLPANVEDAADQLVVAKWIMRQLAYKYGVTITFAPKITVGKAGSGMHIHTRLMKDGKSVMLENNKLSDVAKRAIAGYMTVAASLTAFGNTSPTSYLRLVPHQEAPTNICWGDSNRSVLVRVPLGWTDDAVDMVSKVNPQEPAEKHDFSQKQTVEWRASDCSADVYLLMAGLTVGARTGLEMPDGLAVAEKTYVAVNIFDDKNKSKQSELEQLPSSCVDSAAALERSKQIYLNKGVFSEHMLDFLIANLRKYNDEHLREELGNDTNKIIELVSEYFHIG